MEILIPAARIQERVGELARQIAEDYRQQPVTMIGVLTGSLMFLADLVRHLDGPLRIGLIQASSYRGAVTDPGPLRVGPEFLPDVRGRHVLLLDDILDSGQTLSFLTQHMLNHGAISVKVAVLLRKNKERTHPVNVDYVGFEIPDESVVGYGLDYNDEYRQLPFIAALPAPA